MLGHNLRGVLTALILSWCLVACCTTAFGQRSHQHLTQYIFKSWQQKEGLPALSVLDIQQTQDGFIWLATLGGIVRFDGRDFKVFSKSNTPGLTTKLFDTLYLDRGGRLWVGSSFGYGLFLWDGEGFTNYNRQDGLSNDRVSSLYQDDSGNLWIGTYQGLNMLSPDGRVHIVHDAAGLGLARRHITCFYQRSDGDVLIGTDQGLLAYQNGVIDLPAWAESLRGFKITVVSENESGIWIGTSEHGVHHFDGKTWKVYGSEEGLADDRIYALIRDQHGDIWIGTQRGLNRIIDRNVQYFGEAQGLTHPSVRVLFEDRQGNIWAGTDAGGLNVFFPAIVDTFTKEEGLDSDRVTAIAQDGLGGIWIGTAGAGLNRMLGNVVFSYNSRIAELTDDYINTLMLDRNQQLWIGTNKGITIWSGRHFYPFEGNDWTGSKRVHGLYQDAEGTVWIGTENGAFFFRDGKVQPVDDVSGFQPRLIEDFLEEPGMGIWAASRSGLVQIRNDGIVNVMTKRDGLGDNNVVTLYRDKQGVLWFGTIDGGLHVLREHRIFAVTTQHGLPSDSVLHIEEADQRHLWISSDVGLFSVPKPQLLEVFEGSRERVDSLVLGIDDGMLSLQGSYGSSASGMHMNNGDLWFATTKGAVRIDPDRVSRELRLPQVYLGAVRYGSDNKPLSGPPYILPPDSSRFEVQYTAPAFHPALALQFSSMLEGHESSWAPLSARRSAQYANISPGKYTFRVRVSDEAGHFGEQELAIAIEKEPHFYQTVWFYSLCALLLLLLGNALYRLRIRQLVSRQEELARLVDDRTAQLLEANQRLVEQTLTDPLTGLHNRRFLKEQLDKDVAQVHRHYQAYAQRKDSAKPDNADILFIFVDLDHFKSINDTYGHLVGDQVLLEITDLLRLACRETDSVIRWGGEEFLILARNANREQAPAIAERVRKMIAEHYFDAGEEHIQRTCSVGFAAYPLSRKHPEAVHWERVVDMADNALYAAKYSGRNAWVGINVPDHIGEDVVRSLTSNTMEELAEAGLVEVLSSLSEGSSVSWNRETESA